MDSVTYQFIAKCVRALPRPALVIELGSLNVNGTPRPLFGPVTRYLGVDLRAGDGVDVVCDAADYCPDAPADMVICTSVLEHSPYPERIVRSAWHALRPGGVLILTVPTGGYPPHGVDGGGVGEEYYRNVAEEELRTWLGRFQGWAIEGPTRNQLLALGVK